MAIHSIKFTDTGNNGYINEFKYKDVLKPEFTNDDYLKALMNPKEFRHRFYCRDIHAYFHDQVPDGYKNELARACLLNREFVFSTDKINIIYGPNASGKSTILKTIAAYALCGDERQFDGYTNIKCFEPISYGFGQIPTYDILCSKIERKAGNQAKINWDGNTVYYHNYTHRQNNGSADDLVGTIFGSFGNAAAFELTKSTISDGTQSLYIFNQLYNIAKDNIHVTDLFNISLEHENDIWRSCYETNIEYLKKQYIPGTNQNTILLDEIDRSLDVFNTAIIYKQLLPMLQSVNNHQIIAVTHSPLVLSKTICPDDKYNIISMDDAYTNKVINVFKSLEF